MFLTLSMMIPTASAEGYIPITARITFEGRYSRELVYVKNEYQIRIAPFNNAPLPSKSIITIPQKSKGQFDIIIDEPGTYVYRIYQIKGDDLWKIFHVTDKASHEWHYRGLATSLSELSDTFAYREFLRLIDDVFHANSFIR